MPFIGAHWITQMDRNNPWIVGVSAAVVALVLCAPAYADPDKNENGHARGKNAGREYKEEYREGNCKVEKKWEKDGSYKEERKCDGNDSRLRKEKQHERSPSYFYQQGYTRLPSGHLPPAGECRIWYPDRPSGSQPPPFKCDQARSQVEPGGWLMRPGPQPQEVEVAVYDSRRPGTVVDVGIFDSRTGSIIRIVGTK